jgi:hypothetical protein
VKLYRPVTILVGVVLVIVAGLVRLGEPDQVYEETNRYTKHGKLGKPLTGIDFTLTVNRVRFARAVDPDPDSDAQEEDRPVRTNGIYVTVEYEVEGRHKAGTAGDTTLKADGGSVYQPISQVISDSVNIPEPGFIETSTLIFEANPEDLAGLTLWIKPLAFLTVTTEDYAIDLGIKNAATARELMSKAEAVFPITDGTKRAVQ